MKAIISIALAALVCGVVQPGKAGPSFVYESPGEFLAAGDFNGDGVADVLVLDKSTGNARVGYADVSGNLYWSAPLATGAQNPTGCGVGYLLQTSRAAVAVTSPAMNDINLVDLSNSNSAPSPVVVTPSGIGPHTAVALANPLGSGTIPSYNDLLAASSDNSGSAELLDLMGLNAGVASETGQYGESGPYDRGNALQVAGFPQTFAAGLVRGTNTDTLDIWQFASPAGVALSLTNLPSGSDYTFGLFNDNALYFILYLPGGTNLTMATLLTNGGTLAFGNVWQTNVTEPIAGVFYLSQSAGGNAMIEFTNGVQGMSVSNGVVTFAALYGSGAEAGDVFSGVVPLGAGRFALLDAPPGDLSSAHAQVVAFNGQTYTQLSSGNLPPSTTRSTRAGVWLFESEPFVNRDAVLVASLNTPDWSDSAAGLPGSLAVKVETDGGTTNGLGSPATNNLGAPPPGAAYSLVNQYCSAISVFSYGGPQAAQPVTIAISPPPGPYDASVTISFSSLNGSDQVMYRVGPADSYHLYSSSFTITNDSTIAYYGTNPAQPLRSGLQFASYTVGNNNGITTLTNSPNVTGGSGSGGGSGPGSGNGATNLIISSTVGTVFYGRRPLNTDGSGTIWAINLDGSDDTYITTGVRPRASRDGQWLAFLREGNPFESQGNLWIRNLQTGVEQRLLVNSSTIVCYDWEPDDSGLILDFGCGLYRIGLDGTLSKVIATDCYAEAPGLSPVDERIAYHELNSGATNSAPGLWLAYPDGSSPRRIVSSVPGASWAEWSPDGQILSFADGNSIASLDNGTNLWVVKPDGSSLNRICDFYGTDNHFPHGAIWTPDSSSLVGAGTIFNTNGLWIIPLNADRTDCGGLPVLLPTTPGEAIDFAGSIVIAGQPPMIVTQPQSSILQRGQSGSASVTAVGGPPLHYEWIKDGILLPNQTNSTISFASFSLINSGIYQVVVTNQWGVAISYPVRIAISDAPLVGWGDDLYGELGTGDGGYNFNAGPLITATNVVNASSGYNFTLYVTADGNLWGVGQGGDGDGEFGGEYSSNGLVYNPGWIASNVVEVACGEWNTMYLTADGTLWGMGNNVFGNLGVQLDDLNTDPGVESLGPEFGIYPAIPVASNVVAVAAGQYDTAFITADGSLWTMGDDDYGQLGDGTFNVNYFNCTDIPVNVAENVVTVSASSADTLFVTADGTLWGMGANGSGELGDGTTNMVTWPEFLATNVVGASAGGQHSLYLTADGTLWGMGASADLGIGVPLNQYGQFVSAPPTLIPLALTNHVMAMATEDEGCFYETLDGQLWQSGGIWEMYSYTSWPYPSPGSIADSLFHSEGLTIFAVLDQPCRTSVYTNLTVSPGLPFTLTSSDYGGVPYCYEYLASSGIGTSLDNPNNPAEIAYVDSLQWQLNGVNLPGATNTYYQVANASASDAGVYTVVTIGPFDDGPCLNSATVTVLTPPSAPVITQQPSGIGAIAGQPASVSVAAQGAGAPAVDPLSYEWIKDGVLLPAQTNSTLSFASFQLTNSGVYQVVISNALGLAISLPVLVGVTNAPLRGWGLDVYGQLGSFGYDTETPELVANNAVTAAVGANHSLYVTSDGTLWGMGYDYDGELGDGGTDIQATPEALTNTVVAVAAGQSHSLYLTADGTLWAMGDNLYGELGDGGYFSPYFPAPVATNVVAIAAGGYHSLYLTADGTLWGMGNNADGELGDGTYIPEYFPEPLATNVASLAAGEECSFYITADGRLWAMGDNSQGELGDGGTELNTNQPEVIATNVVAVAAGGYPIPYEGVGGYHSLFITGDGNLWAMGYNGDGELADGGAELSTNLPENVAAGVVAVSAGGAQSYYATADGNLWSAGNNNYGQLGSYYSGSTPEMVTDGQTVTATLAKGPAALHMLAVLGVPPGIYVPEALATNGLPVTFSPIIESGDGPLSYQWQYLGRNIPDATNSTYTIFDAVPDYAGDYQYSVVVTGPYGSEYGYAVYVYPTPPLFYSWYSYISAGSANQVAAGASVFLEPEFFYSPAPTTYQWLKDGAVLPGRNSFYLSINPFALTNTGSYQVVASSVGGTTLTPPLMLAVSNAPLAVWGANNDGQLGVGATTNVSLPQTVASNLVFAAAGKNHSLFVKADGTLWAMGQNDTGQLGDGSTNNAALPELIATNVLAAAAGGTYSLFVTTDSTLWGMGADADGELGDGANATELLPEALTTNVVAVAAGESHSLFLTGDGTLWAMGRNNYGQLGDGSTLSTNQPVVVASNVMAVAAGGGHSLFLTTDQTLWAMGLNSSGQLGLGTTNNALLPVMVAPNVIALAAGDAHSLFVTADGTLWAMGRNDFGQLGIGAITGTNAPVTVAANVVSVSAGADQSLYITGDGRIWAMGRNTSGQLGNGSLNNAASPLPVAGGALVAANLAKGSETSASLAVAGTGPILAPVILAIAVQPNPGGPGTIITLTVNPSQSYLVQVSSDLMTWTSLGSFTPNNLGQLIFTDNGGTSATRFYRLQVM